MAWSPPRTWANGEIVTQTHLNTDVRDQMRELWHELAYVEVAAPVSVTSASTEASPLDIVSSGALTYLALPTMIEFWCPRYQVPSNNAGLNLWDGATDLGRLMLSTAGSDFSPLACFRRLTPTAASHTFKVRGWAVSSTATLHAGAGGVATYLPGYIRVLQRGG